MTGSPEALYRLEDLEVHFPIRAGALDAITRRTRGVVRAVDGIDLELRRGEVLALVGESGSGKTTTGRVIVKLTAPTGGRLTFEGSDVTHLDGGRLRAYRRRVQLIFQDPYETINPKQTINDFVMEPLVVNKIGTRAERQQRTFTALEAAGLRPASDFAFRYPHELSGGQRQRVGIARSLSVGPSVLVADEPVSALDVSVQASILNLLRDLQAEMGFSCLFITHDLATVEYLCDRVAVMYLGKIVESASTAELFSAPKHPYTQALLSAAVTPDPERQRERRRIVLAGEIPSPLDPPSGCAFRTRCPLAQRSAPRSVEEEPELREVVRGHWVACHLVGPGGEAPQLADEAAVHA
jgi:oligopeptide/dipeptide ABC transporter ATP-binding protein